jgi:hypothetical protein
MTLRASLMKPALQSGLIEKRPVREPRAPAIPTLPRYSAGCVGCNGWIGSPPSTSKAFADKRTRPFSSV